MVTAAPDAARNRIDSIGRRSDLRSRSVRAGAIKPQSQPSAPGRVRHSASISVILSRVRKGSIKVK